MKADVDVVEEVATRSISLISGAAAAGACALGATAFAAEPRGAQAAAQADSDRFLGDAKQKFEDAASQFG